jgi:monofunctional biosynthetic peptidoglycan transglycosylase
MAKRSTPKIPKYKRKRKVSWLRRIIGWIIKLVVALLLVSFLWVLAYRFVNPPITTTMIEDILAGRGANKVWMPIGEMDQDMVRAAIAAEDSKFCSHHGFDFLAIENAMKRNASGGRIRGGSTISQQTAKNAFLWQNGGYVRKGAEAWFTFLIEHLWGKRRIMEVYLNLAETGVGTYGVNAGAERYYGHDASAMSAIEAARIAAVLPLPKERGVVAPKGFTRRYGNTIAARISIVERDGLDACIYKGTIPPAKKAPPTVSKASRPIPGAEYENVKSSTPAENSLDESRSPPTETVPAPEQQNTPSTVQEQSQEPGNGV